VAGKKAEEVAGKNGANRVLVRAAEKAAGNNAGGNFDSRCFGLARIGTTPTSILIGLVSFAQPWLPLCRELCGSFSTNAQSFFFAVQLWLPS
jgi:hypothetical protein